MKALKTILAVGAVAIGGGLLFGKNKYDGFSQIKDNLEINVKAVNNIKLSNGNIVFDVDVEINNPTSIGVNLPGNNLTIKTLNFHAPSGKKLGYAMPNLSDINLPANSTRRINNIPTIVSLTNIGSSFSEVVAIILDSTKLRVGADIEVFGKQFNIDA